jgi:hypothetical protein
MSDSADNLGYAAAFDSYWQAGWRGVLPLHKGSKWPPPPFQKPRDGTPRTSYTGYSGVDPSYGDILAWAEDFRDGNLALRLPDGIVGIDVDGYGAKTGSQTFAEAIKRWGPLPPAPRSSSRQDDLVSGIRLFRVQPGTALQTKIDFPELGIGDIEIIQRHHRYVVAWPSIHPEGRGYWWVNDEGQLLGVPEPDTLPWLPDTWVTGLRVQPRSQIETTDYNVRLALTEGQSSMRVQSRLRDAIRELNTPGSSRHDTALRHVMALLRMGKTGEAGVKAALQLLCDVFIAAVTVDGSRNPDIARSEFIRMIDNDNAARELSQPSVTDWFNAMVVDTGQISPETPGNGAKTVENEPNSPENDDTPTGGVVGVSADAATGVDNAAEPSTAASAASTKSDLEYVERGFWESRESLRMIYQTSMAQMCSPWAVLAQCAMRALAQVRPHVTLPPLIGGPGSLNWFVAIVAPSGRGKGASGACADLLIPPQGIRRNLGTGEGVVDAFVKPANKETGEPKGWYESVMLVADEIDTLAALRSRSGSTLMGILRSGFSGETLGFSYRSNSDHLEAHTYRMTMILSVQPEKADWIISDAAGGTPQRLMWFPATDERISRDRPWPAGQLALPNAGEWQYPREILLPKEAEELIIDEHVKRNQGVVEALDGHALFCREKFAYALTVLDNRVDMSLEDWELSGVAADVSTYTRELTVHAIVEAARMDAIDRGELKGAEMSAAEAAKAYESTERVRRILRKLLSTIEAAGEDGILKRDINHTFHSRDRKYLDGALDHAKSSGLVAQHPETNRWVKL